MIDRHDALRSTFDPKRNCLRILERVADRDRQLVDLSSDDPRASARRISRKLIRDDACQPFDLVNGPLVRAVLVRLEHDLSRSGLHDPPPRLRRLVDQRAARRAEPALCLEMRGNGLRLCRTGDAVQPLRSRPGRVGARAPSAAAVEAWWVEQFATPVSPLELPTDRPRGSVKSYPGDTARHTIGPERYHGSSDLAPSRVAPCSRPCWPASRSCCIA